MENSIIQMENYEDMWKIKMDSYGIVREENTEQPGRSLAKRYERSKLVLSNYKSN